MGFLLSVLFSPRLDRSRSPCRLSECDSAGLCIWGLPSVSPFCSLSFMDELFIGVGMKFPLSRPPPSVRQNSLLLASFDFCAPNPCPSGGLRKARPSRVDLLVLGGLGSRGDMPSLSSYPRFPLILGLFFSPVDVVLEYGHLKVPPTNETSSQSSRGRESFFASSPAFWVSHNAAQTP